jgi:predicted RNA-binding protein YlqC (UPF0109 family)
VASFHPSAGSAQADKEGIMKEFVEFVAKQLVDQPDQVVVEEQEKEEGKLVLTLKVSEKDVGKIIGRSGRTAGAFRVLLRAVAAKNGKRAVLEIAD